VAAEPDGGRNRVVNAEVARCVQEAFSGPTFRLYTNADPAGVEVEPP
jgi:glycerol-3-phosphate dehydrogenase